MAHCGNCSKFVSLDDGDPEANIDDPEIADGMLTITGSVRIVRNCAECGDELRSADFDLNEEIELSEHTCETEKVKLQERPEVKPTDPYKIEVTLPEPIKSVEESVVPSPVESAPIEAKDNEPEYECEVGEAEMTSRTEGKGRGMKTFYGFEVLYTVICTKCNAEVLAGTIKDEIQASHMEQP